jgi:4-amino-4-deoxy-L-arabinose transferase-like glycosyltransferase
MTRRAATFVIPVMLGVAALGLALTGSGGVTAPPTVIEADLEAGSRALNQSFAESATVFFPMRGFPPGREPLPVYATAVSTRLFGDSRLSVRLPNAFLAALSVALLYAFARRAFDARAALIAPLLLLASPIHVMSSRAADNAPYPQLFAIGWLLCVAHALTQGGPVYWALAGVVLGGGVYTHPSAIVVMPLLLGITLVVVWTSGRDRVRTSAGMLAGFGLLMVPWMVWQTAHADRLASLAGHYRLYDPNLNVLQGIRDLTSYHGLSVRSYTYWQYFSPSLWFYAGEPVAFASTQHIGALLLPVCIFTGAGALSLLARRRPLDLLILGGTLAGPAAAALEPTLVDLRRALIMVPCVVLMTSAGYERLVRAESPARRAVPVIAVLAAIQFGLFARAYLLG